MLDLEENLGIRKNELYEVLATTFSLNPKSFSFVPNTSCMGIIFLDDEYISLKPYTSTHTYENLRESNVVSLNLTDNVFLFCLAALKGKIIDENRIEIPNDYYNYNEISSNETGLKDVRFPYLKEAWGVLFCRVEHFSVEETKDEIGKAKRALFRLKIIDIKKIRESYKLFNRAENLIIEALVLLTRLDIIDKRGQNHLHNEYSERIKSYLSEILKFSKNSQILMSVRLIKSYLESIN